MNDKLKTILIVLMLVILMGGVQAACVLSLERAKACNKNWHAFDDHWYTCAWSMKD